MPKHHMIISGTGRTGTTFLVQLLTDLGFDTGFTDYSSGLFANCDAGMEWDIRRADAPYVIKSPWLCNYLDEVLQSGEYDRFLQSFRRVARPDLVHNFSPQDVSTD